MYASPLYNEKQLQQALVTGDTRAFESLYSHYKEPLETFLFRYVKVTELAEDLCQEIFSGIWENRSTMSEVQSFRAYLHVVSRNHALNFLKRASRIDIAKAMMLAQLPKPISMADNKLLADEYKQWLQNILDQMSPQMRQVFQLVRQEHKSYDEVAEALGISRNTVKKHMTRSVAKLKRKLADELGIQLTLFSMITGIL